VTVLLKKTLVKDRAYAAHDVDEFRGGALAVALRTPSGWTVACDGGRIVAERLDQRRATALMLATASQVAGRAAVRRLLRGAA
jgi:hypothetical protein